MFYELIKPAFFRIDPEQAHDLVMGWMEKTGPCRVTRGIAKSIYYLEDSLLTQTLWGLRFGNPVGMAAGFDKNARAIQGLTALGFGFIEIGTVFPNEGADAVATRMAALGEQPVPIGINLGKNKDTALEDAAADYVAALEKLFPYGDYCVVNVSSPNTPGLRLSQGADYLETLMAEVQAATQAL